MKPARCHFCERTFKNRQGVRAHLKACPVYRVVRQLPQADTPSVKALPSVTNSAGSKRPGRQSQERLLDLLDVHEQLQQFLDETAMRAKLAQLLSSFPGYTGAPAGAWTAVYQDLSLCVRDCHQMVLQMRLDHDLLFGLYHQLECVQTRWLRCRTFAVDRYEPDVPSPAGLEEDLARWSRLAEKVKRMLVKIGRAHV